jgi:hypothetical protein
MCACRNNNGGAVAKSLRQGLAVGPTATLDVIAEDEEEEGEEDSGAGHVIVADVPQCFSHFTWAHTYGEKLVCDLQV